MPHAFLIQQATMLCAVITATMTLISSGPGFLLSSALLGLSAGGLEVFSARQLSRLFIQEEALSVEAWASAFRGVGALLGIPLTGIHFSALIGLVAQKGFFSG